MKNIGIVFPGQGSQYVGMGKELYENRSQVRDVFETGTRITGIDLKNICFEGPESVLTETSVCQVAIFTLDVACYRILKDLLPFSPAFAAGHSLGEYAAFSAAGTFSLEDGFRLVSKRAAFMKMAAEKNPGMMAAVLGKTELEVAGMTGNFAGVGISNINAEGQIVVGGSVENVMRFLDYLAASKIKAVPLKVSGAFHTPLMGSAYDMLSEEIEKTDIRIPQFPVYSNFTGGIPGSAGDIKNALIKQLVSPVRWLEIMKDFSAVKDIVTVELGPKKVLSGIIHKTCSEIVTLNVEDEKTLSETIETLKRETI